MELTLDEVWLKCLDQWDFIDKHAEQDGSPRNRDLVLRLKCKWMKRSGLLFLNHDCLFCWYHQTMLGTRTSNTTNICSHCPGVLVDETFNCYDPKYSFFDRPHAFFRELKRLHSIYLQRKQNGNELG